MIDLLRSSELYRQKTLAHLQLNLATRSRAKTLPPRWLNRASALPVVVFEGRATRPEDPYNEQLDDL